MCFYKAVIHCRLGHQNARMYYHLRENWSPHCFYIQGVWKAKKLDHFIMGIINLFLVLLNCIKYFIMYIVYTSKSMLFDTYFWEYYMTQLQYNSDCILSEYVEKDEWDVISRNITKRAKWSYYQYRIMETVCWWCICQCEDTV